MKKSIKLLLLAALAWPGWLSASAEVTPITAEKVLRPVYHGNTKEICNNYGENYYVPIRCRYVNEAVRGQMIYSASTLGITENNYITSITFHATENLGRNNPNNATYSTITLKIGETTQSGYSSATFIETGLTRACTMTSGFFTGSQTVTFIFDEPYQYKGGNLVIDVSSDGAGNVYGSSYVSWSGLSSNNGDRTCVYKSSSSASAERARFLPYITVEHGTFTTVEADAPVSGNTEFFSNEDFNYTWKVNGVGEEEHSAKLTDIATDPDQIIALLKKVYTDPNIPGNYKRGYKVGGADDHDNNVTYTGEGQINSSHRWADSYGWNIEGDVNSGTSGNYQYWYMDPNQYKPNQEGVTLLLLEMVDDFKYAVENQSITESTSDYAKLRDYVSKAIKSARVITEAKRTGSGFDAGTLFKIDCDKMNKFYLIAKGQLLWFSPTIENEDYTFYNNPCYIYRRNNVNSYVDYGLSYNYLETCAFLGHMFEQFSPSTGSSSGEESKPRDDIYQDLVTDMETFGVVHDCPNVPYVGHHFMMYGEDSHSADCADVRDMLFFVPDYRMMNHSNRSPESNSSRRDYFNYNPDHLPTMGVFGIHQDEIPAGNEIESQRYTDDTDKSKWKSLYHHQLQWWSNLDEFLPNDEQYYELWEIVTDEFGVEKYQQVYYRNERGEYRVDRDGSTGWVSDTTGLSKYLAPIVLNRDDANPFNAQNPNNANKQIVKMKYPDVYVDMKAGSQIKTYVIRGRDKGAEGGEPFLSLQWSNLEQVIIPGLDPNERVRLIGTTYYSRYNPDNEKNCYSNKLEIPQNAIDLTPQDLIGKSLIFYRSSRAAQTDENGNVMTDAQGNILYAQKADEIPFAEGSFDGDVLTITLDCQSPKSEFPVGSEDGKTAGYHKNKGDTNVLTFPRKINEDNENNGLVNFENLYFFDNFTVDVSKNAHPARYLYKMEVGDAYSNEVPVPVYKTDSKINNSLTIDQVVADTQMAPEYTPGYVMLDTKVQLSSKSEILRYDAYRWRESDKRYLVDYGGDTDDQEEDFDPTGIAQNQDGYYTVTMNEDTGPYYYVAPASALPHVDEANPTNWATFVDKYPKMQEEVDAYVYAPVVESFGKGYYEKLENNDKQVVRRDYNTYGGPMKNTALGKLEVEVMKPYVEKDANGNIIDDHSLMSNYKWYDNGWYSYYNIYLNFTALDVPEGYKLYKVRAWRKVDKNILGEELETRKVRIPVDQEGNPSTDWYMYEDMNFGDPLDMSGDPGKLMGSQYFMERKHILGERSAMIAKPINPDGTGGGRLFEVDTNGNPNVGDGAIQEDGVQNEVRATFGAQRLEIDGDDSGKLKNLNAEFKVRAYFTKSTNPLILEPITTTVLSPIYVIGNSNMSGSWDPTKALAILYTDDGKNYEGTFTPNDAGDGYGYFSLTNKLSSDPNDWDQIASNRIQPVETPKEVPAADVQLKYYKNGQNCFKAEAGKTYNLTLTDYVVSTENGANAGVLTVTELPSSSNAPRRAEADNKTAYDYDYYVAEGTAEFKSEEYDNIITGISGVKADVNREVVSVTYVNPLGQQSSRPFSGVNMVVTRYSDGSATTTKVVK